MHVGLPMPRLHFQADGNVVHGPAVEPLQPFDLPKGVHGGGAR